VAHILEGSVRRAGKQLRITAQLIHAGNGFHIWSETYDREMANIFAVQDEVSAAIVAALKDRLGLKVEAAPPLTTTASIEAHDALLLGRHWVVKRGQSDIKEAIRAFEKAIALDPDYALAHAELSIALSLSAILPPRDYPKAELWVRATSHAEQALALDPNLAEAHVASAMPFVWWEFDPDAALPWLIRATELNPNYAYAYTVLGFAYLGHGLYQEEFRARTKARELSPMTWVEIFYYLQNLYERDRISDARREVPRLAAVHPDYAAYWSFMLKYETWQWSDKLLASLDANRTDDDWLAIIGLEREALDMKDEADAWTAKILGRVDQARAIAEAEFDNYPDRKGLWYDGTKHQFAVSLAAAGEYTRAGPLLEAWWKESGGRIAIWRFQSNAAYALIAIRRETGAGVDDLLAALKDHVQRLREAGLVKSVSGGFVTMANTDFEEGMVEFLSGHRERGLELISRAFEAGWVIEPNNAYLQVLYNDPGFAPIQERQQARLAQERQKFLNVVCNDNPYADSWQPAEGTCERFAAEGGE
jgi:tetratricopeptide (TPR) repeat protein